MCKLDLICFLFLFIICMKIEYGSLSFFALACICGLILFFMRPSHLSLLVCCCNYAAFQCDQIITTEDRVLDTPPRESYSSSSSSITFFLLSSTSFSWNLKLLDTQMIREYSLQVQAS